MQTLLINPFKKYQENKLFIVGLVATLLGSYFAFIFRARFEGVLDMHLGNARNYWVPFLDNCINISLLSLLLFLVGIYLNKKTRFIDILNVVLIARIPFYILPFFNFNFTLENSTNELMNSLLNNQIPDLSTISITSLIFLGIFAIISLLFLMWFFILLFNGFKIASNAKGTKAILMFSLSILFSEIASKIIIYNLPY